MFFQPLQSDLTVFTLTNHYFVLGCLCSINNLRQAAADVFVMV